MGRVSSKLVLETVPTSDPTLPDDDDRQTS
jgi:hypothetical protein